MKRRENNGEYRADCDFVQSARIQYMCLLFEIKNTNAKINIGKQAREQRKNGTDKNERDANTRR